MEQQEYSVLGRKFRNLSDYRLALKDAETINNIKEKITSGSLEHSRAIMLIENGTYKFNTLLGEDFLDDLKSGNILCTEAHGNVGKQGNFKAKDKSTARKVEISDEFVKEEMKRMEKKRHLFIFMLVTVAFISFAYLSIYYFFSKRTSDTYEELKTIKENSIQKDKGEPLEDEPVVIHYTDDDVSVPDVLPEYKNLLNRNKKLIGWIRIADTSNGEVFLDYPVMQTTDNEYYLDHNLDQEYDKNGSIFMDKDCDVIRQSTNYILYGHHMKSGNMFGRLDKYEKEAFYENHKIIEFDTIYEKAEYEVMYVFRSHVFSEEEIAFKYYQFIDAGSETEFDSYMNDMNDMSIIDTGVTASFGDHLLTLSTCDYQEKNGRFVVVAKKITTKE